MGDVGAAARAVRHTVRVGTVEARRIKAPLSEAQLAWRQEQLGAVAERLAGIRNVVRDPAYVPGGTSRREDLAVGVIRQVLAQVTHLRRDLREIDRRAGRDELTLDEYWVAYAAAVSPSLGEMEDYLTSMAEHLQSLNVAPGQVGGR